MKLITKVCISMLLLGIGTTAYSQDTTAKTLLQQAIHQTDTQNYDSSLIYTQQALDILDLSNLDKTSTANKRLYLIGRNLKGRASHELRKHTDLKAFLLESVKLNERLLGMADSITAIAYFNLGLHDHRAGEYSEALTHYEKARAIQARTIGESSLPIADTYYRMGITHRLSRSLDSSLESYEAALKIWEKAYGKSHPKVARCINSIGIAALDQGEFKTAEKSFKKALQLFIDLRGKTYYKVGDVQNNLGLLYYRKGDYERALQNYQAALNTYKANYDEDHPDVVLTYNNIGLVYQGQKEYDNALDFYKRAARIIHDAYSPTHPELARVYNNLGVVYQLRKQYEEATQYYNDAISIWQRETDVYAYGIALSYHNLGLIILEQVETGGTSNESEITKAIQLFKQSINLLEQDQDRLKLPSVLSSLAHAYQIQSDFVQSEHLLQRALKQASTVYKKKHPVISEIYLRFGKLYEAKQQLKKAEKYYQKSIDASVLNRDLLEPTDRLNRSDDILSYSSAIAACHAKAQLLFKRYEVEQKEADLEESLALYNVSFELIDLMWISFEYDNQKLELFEDSHEIYEEGMSVALKLYHISKKNTYKEIAYKIMANQKAAVLHQALVREKVKQFSGIPPDLLEEAQSLRLSCTNLEQQLFELGQQTTNDPEALEVLEQKLFSSKQGYSDLLTHFQQNYPKYYELTQTIDYLSLQEVQKQLLQKEQALIEYFVGEETIWAFVVTKDDAKVIEIPNDFPLEQWVEQVRSSIYKPFLTEGLDEKNYLNQLEISANLSHRLYRQLFLPIESAIDLPEDIVVIPDGILGYLPFDVLLKEYPTDLSLYANYQYLINDYQFSYNYSVGLWEEMQTQQYNPEYHTIIAMAPSFSGKQQHATRQINDKYYFPPLKFNHAEVETITNAYRGVTYTGSKATEQKFLEEAPKYSIIHLATHGKANADAGDYSFLAFTTIEDSIENELLYTNDLYNLDLNAEMVVLSACETGVGEAYQGEGIISLARGFAYAGAGSIITSLWSVNDKSTNELMVKFYDYLHQGKQKSVALRQAKLDYMQQYRHDAHPFFWAAFVPIGNMAAIPSVTTTHSYLLIFLSIIGAILLLSCIFFVKKMFLK